jgi:hypothetical protein
MVAWLHGAEMKESRFEQIWKEPVMAFFSLGSGSRRAKPKRTQRFEPADCVVVKAFADLNKGSLSAKQSIPRDDTG